MALSTLDTVALGVVAGGTVFLGLPVARLSVSERYTHLLNGGAVGVLVFLLVEILHGALTPVEHAVETTVETGVPHLLLPLALVVGLSVGLVGLARFSSRMTSNASTAQTTALLIAAGIGFHNFSEGLAIGSSAANGAISLATVLVVGFALHNITEGFGVAAPLSNTETSTAYLGGLGLVAGGPTFLGTVVGHFWTSDVASVLFLALAGGALVYVVQELFTVTRHDVTKQAFFSAITVGFVAAFATELVVELAMGA